MGRLQPIVVRRRILTKGLGRVKTEMSLHVLAYYVKRLMNVKAYATPGDG